MKTEDPQGQPKQEGSKAIVWHVQSYNKDVPLWDLKPFWGTALLTPNVHCFPQPNRFSNSAVTS
jgi:hypothetical protein